MSEKLPSKVQKFIVELLACFETPTDVARAVKEEYELEVDKQRVHYYDPTKKASSAGLSKKLIEHFWVTRNKYMEDQAERLSKLKYRQGLRSEMIRRTLEKGNYPLVDALLVNAAKDEGGLFTNQRVHSGPGGGAISISLESQKKETVERMFKKLVEKGQTGEEAKATLIAMGVDESDIPTIRNNQG
jgi:hypothetical protein